MSITLQKVEIDSRTVQLFKDEESGKVTGYSFSQDKYYADPLNELPPDFKTIRVSKTKEEVDEALRAIKAYPIKALDDRHLRRETLERFDIRTGLSEQDGETVTTIHFPYERDGKLVYYKTKLIEPKRFWAIGDKYNIQPFGWRQAVESGSPKLIITEGELDVVAAYQILKDRNKGTKWSDIEPAVISLINGAGSAKEFMAKWSGPINRNFKEVVLAFDMDGPGRKAAKDASLIMPSVLVAELPAHDAGACLMQGRMKAFANSLLFRSVKLKNTRLIEIDTLFQRAREPMQPGLSYPWQGLTDLTRGIYFGQTVYITAPEKVGKSELLNALVSHLVMEHGIKCFLMKPEEDPIHTVKLLAGKMVGKFFNDPDIEFDYKAYDKATAILAGNVKILDVYQDLSWETMKVDITSAAVAGFKAVFVDPLTAATTGLSSSDANTKLQEIAQGLSTIAKDLDIVIFIFTHTRNPKHGAAFNRGGQIQVGDITGGRAMGRSAHQVIALQSNQDPALPIEERNIRELVLLADRNHGAIGKIKLYWDRFTSLFEEIKG